MKPPDRENQSIFIFHHLNTPTMPLPEDEAFQNYIDPKESKEQSDLDNFTVKDANFKLPESGVCHFCGAKFGEPHGVVAVPNGIGLMECPFAVFF